jgi:hypothetical protein
MEPHRQSPWYLCEIPSYAKALACQRTCSASTSEGYPPVATSAGALILRYMNNTPEAYVFMHGQCPWSSA